MKTLSLRMGMNGKSLLMLTALLFLPAPSPLLAQSQRLELGRRLKRFELAWETAPRPQRADCVDPLKKAVNSFFGLRIAEAARQLDNAWLIARGQRATEFQQSVIGLQLLPSPICADVSTETMQLEMRPFYGSEFPMPDKAVVVVTLRCPEGELLATKEYSLQELRSRAKWSTGTVREGDHVLSSVIQWNGEAFPLPDITITRMSNLSDRLASLENAARAIETSATTDFQRTIVATLREESRVLKNLSEGQLQECDLPLLSRLQFCESLCASVAEPNAALRSFAGKSDVWMTLAKGSRTVRTRIRLPASDTQPVPVLFVFHGAGGSENMFFETYGAGRVVREAEQRGWLVIAPGQGLFGLPLGIQEMLDAIEPLVKIDRGRVMLMGHSMGAAQVMQQVRKDPSLPIAAVALGGGGRMAIKVPDPKPARLTAWFVGAGDEDFGRSGAQQLHRSLADAGLSSQYQEYPSVEHLVVVQAAIDDAFRFLDQTLPK